MFRDSNLFIKLLALYLFFIPLDFLPILPGVSVSKILIFLPIIGFVLEIRNGIVLRKNLLPLITYLIIHLVLLLFSMDLNASLGKYFTISINIILIIFLTTCGYSNEDIHFLYSAMKLSGWLLLLLSLKFSNFNLFQGRLVIIINGVRQDPNEMCGFLIFSICCYLNEFFETNRKRALLFVLTFMGLIIFSGSRGGIAASLISQIVILYKYRNISKNSGKITRVLLFGFLGLWIIWSLLPETLIDRLSVDYLVNEVNESSRGIIWKQLLDSYSNSTILRKLVGHGMATVINFNSSGSVAHNVLIEMLIETGLIGFFAQLGIYCYFFLVIRKSQRIEIYASYLGYLTMALFLSIYSYKPLWNIVLIGLILANFKNMNKFSQKSRE